MSNDADLMQEFLDSIHYQEDGEDYLEEDDGGDPEERADTVVRVEHMSRYDARVKRPGSRGGHIIGYRNGEPIYGVHHGTSREAAEHIGEHGFGTAMRFKGMENSPHMSRYTFVTLSKSAAKWYAESRIGNTAPAVVSGNFRGKILEVDAKGVEKYGALKAAVESLGKRMPMKGEHEMDVDAAVALIKESGHHAISFKDKDSGNRQAVWVLSPERLEVEPRRSKRVRSKSK